jgi:hypothetical protein
MSLVPNSSAVTVIYAVIFQRQPLFETFDHFDPVSTVAHQSSPSFKQGIAKILHHHFL